jgi:uncharacterized protein (DUF1800 family)
VAAQGTWTEAHVRRLFWRAGFGATPEEASRWAGRGRDATIKFMLDGGGGPELVGPAPDIGQPLDPVNEWGHDVLWWLDRMVRSQRPLVEKMTLFWHDHFATLDQDTPLMLAQNRKLRRHALGDFRRLLREVTRDPAMQLFLSLAGSTKYAPNENFARELMELFTLGKGYSERDIREAARALTGFQDRWENGDFKGIRYDKRLHDTGVKRIFGKRGRFDWRDVLELVVAHKNHPPFLVGKLWDFYVTSPIDRRTRSRLAKLYRRSRHRIKPVVAEILKHPALFSDLDRPDMVKSPVVFVAGNLRMAGAGVQTDDWAWLLGGMGQQLFEPPSVAGWEWGPPWMSTNTIKARFSAVTHLTRKGAQLHLPDGSTPPDLSPADAVARARAAVGEPWTSAETNGSLERMAASYFSDLRPSDRRRQQRADMLQRALRHLLLSGPDGQLH